LGPDASPEALAKQINHFEIARPWQKISQQWAHAIIAQCVPQIESDRCGGADLVLIPVLKPQRRESTISKLPGPGQMFRRNGHMPSRRNDFEIARPWQNISQQ
jgi:hypothetical protein